jgi:hypothetical protein
VGCPTPHIAKVAAAGGDIQGMENTNDIPFGPGHPRYEEAQALENTIRIVRRAQGKKNPEDFPYGSPAWHEADEDYMRDLLRAMGGDPDEIEE